MSPRPSTAVPLVMTPTRLPRLVYLKAAFGSATISSQGAANARRIRQREVALVGQLLGRGDRHLARGWLLVVFECGAAQFCALVFLLRHRVISP